MERQSAQTGRTVQQRLAHQRGALCAGLRECHPGDAVAVEATGNCFPCTFGWRVYLAGGL
jgi:hypothetical protein